MTRQTIGSPLVIPYLEEKKFNQLLANLPLPKPATPRKRVRLNLPPDLVRRMDLFRKRTKPYAADIATYRQSTVEFALELMLALEPYIFGEDTNEPSNTP